MEHINHEVDRALANNVVKGAAVALLQKPDYNPGQRGIAVNVCALAELLKVVACGDLILSYTTRSNVQGLDDQSQDRQGIRRPNDGHINLNVAT